MWLTLTSKLRYHLVGSTSFGFALRLVSSYMAPTKITLVIHSYNGSRRARICI